MKEESSHQHQVVATMPSSSFSPKVVADKKCTNNNNNSTEGSIIMNETLLKMSKQLSTTTTNPSYPSKNNEKENESISSTTTDNTTASEASSDSPIAAAVVPLLQAELPIIVELESECLLLRQNILAPVGTLTWHEQFLSIEMSRRAIVHHTLYFRSFFDVDNSTTIVSRLVKLLLRSSTDLRSAIAKNALLGVADLIQFVGIHDVWTAGCLPAIVKTLLAMSACELKFLREAADEAIGAIVTAASSSNSSNSSATATYDVVVDAVLIVALKVCNDKNPRLVSSAAVHVESLLKKQHHKAGVAFAEEDTIEALVAGLASFFTAKSSVARAASRSSLKLLRKVLGHADFELRLRKNVVDVMTANAMIVESKVVTGKSKAAGTVSAAIGLGSTQTRPSLRDLIRQRKAKKVTATGASAAVTPVVVVVVKEALPTNS